ncbi:MAG: methyltransferase [Candidatus Altiarchaeota archaeon]
MKPIRILYLSLLAVVTLLLLPSILSHFIWLMGGEGLPNIVKGRWDIAAVNVLFFGFFIVLTQYRRRVDWRSRNIYIAFIIALFAEMYGFPLTAYFMANYFGTVPVDYEPAYNLSLSFMGVYFTLPTMMIVGGAVTVFGLALITVGWYQIYKSKGGLVTNGLYKYSRHPQYVGILLVTLGWVIHWPTIITILLWPALAVIYFRLARAEESDVRKEYENEFEKYAKVTPMFI